VTNSDARPTFDKFRTNPIAVPQLPSATERRARTRGYLRMLVKPHETETRVCFVPVFGDLALIARKTDLVIVISIDAGDAVIEPLGWSASSLGWFRRRLTPLRRTVLNFDGVEIFPEGSKSRTRDYRKLVKSARVARMPFDGAFLAAHQELILGWGAEPGVLTEPAGPDEPAIAIAIHLHYVDLWPEIETLLGRWHTPFKLFLTLTSSNAALEQRVRAKYHDCEIRIVENSGRDRVLFCRCSRKAHSTLLISSARSMEAVVTPGISSSIGGTGAACDLSRSHRFRAAGDEHPEPVRKPTPIGHRWPRTFSRLITPRQAWRDDGRE
jgi:Rhamnan synthesis protein F